MKSTAMLNFIILLIYKAKKKSHLRYENMHCCGIPTKKEGCHHAF
jgi:hypothetical protein